MPASRVLDWLLEPSQPAVERLALVDLEGRRPDDPDVKAAESEIPVTGWAHEILASQRPDGLWGGKKAEMYVPKYSAFNWRMIVLSDLGLTKANHGVRKGCGLYFSEWLKGEFEKDGEVCIVGNLARELARFGYADDPRVVRLYDWLVGAQKEDGGWHCFDSDVGTLDCWEALAAFAVLPRQKWTKGMKNSVEKGAKFYLERELLHEGKEYGPWLRIHYPVHYYYDFLVGLDTLTALGFGSDRRLKEALELMRKKRRPDGKWVLDKAHPDLAAGSNYPPGSKGPPKWKARPLILEEPGEPSKWATFTCLRVEKRVEEA